MCPKNVCQKLDALSLVKVAQGMDPLSLAGAAKNQDSRPSIAAQMLDQSSPKPAIPESEPPSPTKVDQTLDSSLMSGLDLKLEPAVLGHLIKVLCALTIFASIPLVVTFFC